jgi:5-methylcytosine-specific restriction endonuclease McrA
MAGLSEARKRAVRNAMRKRNYRKEYDGYHGKEEQVKNRSTRNKARKKKGLAKGDSREVDHETPLSGGGGNSDENLRVVSRKTNRKKHDRVV